MVELKKGDKCIVKGFTGIKLGVFEVAAASKKTVTVLKKNGGEMIFDRKIGRQVNVEEGKEKYANTIMEDDGSYVALNRGEKKQPSKPKKVAKKKPEPEPEEDDEDDFDEDEEEEPKPVKKTNKKSPKKVTKKPEPDDDDFEDDEGFEDIDD